MEGEGNGWMDGGRAAREELREREGKGKGRRRTLLLELEGRCLDPESFFTGVKLQGACKDVRERLGRLGAHRGRLASHGAADAGRYRHQNLEGFGEGDPLQPEVDVIGELLDGAVEDEVDVLQRGELRLRCPEAELGSSTGLRCVPSPQDFKTL
eukprot:2821838-Rhodomonas_salina.1